MRPRRRYYIHFAVSHLWGTTDEVLAQLFNPPLPHVIETAGLQLRCIGALKSPQDVRASANDPPSFSDCSLTGLGELALCLSVGVRRCQLLTLALALGKGKIGILMVACMETGDPFELQHKRGLGEIELANLKAHSVWLKHLSCEQSGSDLCGACNKYIECFGQNDEFLNQRWIASKHCLDQFQKVARDVAHRLLGFLQQPSRKEGAAEMITQISDFHKILEQVRPFDKITVNELLA